MTRYGEVESLGAFASDQEKNHQYQGGSWIEIPIENRPNLHWYDHGDTSAASTFDVTVPGFQDDQTVLLSVLTVREDSTSAATPTITNSTTTWVQVASTAFDTTGADRGRLTLFRTQVDAGAIDSVTIDCGGATQAHISYKLMYLTGELRNGTNGSAAIIQSATGTSTSGADVSASLSAFSHASNMTVAFVGATREAGYPVAANPPGNDWIDLHDSEYDTGSYFAGNIAYKMWTQDTSPTADLTSHDAAGMIAIEIGYDTTANTPDVGDIASPGVAGMSSNTATYLLQLNNLKFKFGT